MALHADIVVIGSGAGGSAVAGELQRGGATVILVEAGSQVAPGPSWHGRNAFPAEASLPRFAEFMAQALSPFAGSEPAPRQLPGSVVAHALGGLMVTWTHNCPSPHPMLEPVAGVRPEDLARGLDRARQLLSVSSAITDGGVRQGRLLRRARQLYPNAHRPAEPMPLAARIDAGGSVTPRRATSCSATAAKLLIG
jgi:choline dehydrogenase-like flavoprotein